MAQQIPPPAKGMSPRDYYGFLTQQGVPGWAAYDSVRNYYGTPQQAQEQAAEDAQPGMGYQLGQVGGYVGGALLGGEIASGGAGIGSLFGGGAGAAGAGAAGAGASGVGAAGAGAAGAGAAGAGAAGAGAGAAGAGTAGAAGVGATGAGAATTMPALAAAAVPAAVIVATVAAAANYNRMSKKTKTMDRDEALRYAAKDPINWVIPAGFIAAAFGDKDMYLTEHRKLLDLQEKGVNVPESFLANTRLARGRSKEELVQIERDKERAGLYSNAKFAESRNVADLKPEDIWGYATWLKRFGNDWLEKYSEDQRKQIAQAALNRGLVKEHRGTVDVKFSPELEDDITNIVMNKPASAAGSTTTPKPPAPSLSPDELNQVQSALGQLEPIRKAIEPKPAPVQWSKEAQQRELTRRLQRQRR